MSGIYQTLLTLSLGSVALFVGALAVLYQVAATAGPEPLTRLVIRWRWAVPAAVLLIVTFITSLVGAVFTADSTVVSDLDDVLRGALNNPAIPLALGLLTLLATVLAVVATARGARALTPQGAAITLLHNAGEPEGDGWASRLDAYFQVVRKAARDGRTSDLEDCLAGLTDSIKRVDGASAARSKALSSVVDGHVIGLVRDIARIGHADSLVVVVRWSSDLLPSVDGTAAFSAIFKVQLEAAEALIELRATTDLAEVISYLELLGVGAARKNEEPTFDEVCRELGSLGERIPARFLDPSAPDVLMTPNAVAFQVKSPVDALLEALSGLLDGVYPYGEAPSSVDLLVWRDAVFSAAKALVVRGEQTFTDNRLEMPLVALGILLARAMEMGWRHHHVRPIWIMLIDLANLAERPDPGFYSEWRHDLATWLVEGGMYAEDLAAQIPAGGGEVADIAADAVRDHFGDDAGPIVRDLFVAGRLGALPSQSRWAFIKRLGVSMGTNFGMGFDPVTGRDTPHHPPSAGA